MFDYSVRNQNDEIYSIRIDIDTGLHVTISKDQIQIFDSEGLNILDWITEVGATKMLVANSKIHAGGRNHSYKRQFSNVDYDLPRLLKELSKFYQKEEIEAAFSSMKTYQLVDLLTAKSTYKIRQFFENL